MEENLRIVVGLGNPGPRYEKTRHNIGFRLVERLARDLGAGAERDEGGYRVAWAELAELRVALVKPQTFMNRSGDALTRFPASREAGPENHLVVLDDVALPFGSMRFRGNGRSGGHKGLASVLATMHTVNVPRLRLGVGAGEPGCDLTEYVLEEFTSLEERSVPFWLRRAGEGVRVFLTEGPEEAMTRFNRKITGSDPDLTD